METVFEERRRERQFQLIEDAIDEMNWWACFDQDRSPRRYGEVYPKKSNPAVKVDKVGRNDPCPCGSGKKFKKCCGE